jgi:hypothetical protein
MMFLLASTFVSANFDVNTCANLVGAAHTTCMQVASANRVCPILRRNGVRIFGVGAAKTGTHTIGEMFKGIVPAAHERDAEELINLMLESKATGSNVRLVERLLARDCQHGLKIDSSHVNVYLIEELEGLFPDSRYILTLRQPLHWLRSFVDHSLGQGASDAWMRFRDFRFGATINHPPQEAPLSERDLYTLVGYLHYWRDAIERIITLIPPERLLIVQTEDIGKRIDEIAAFCGVPLRGRAPKTTHAFPARHRFGVLDEVDRDYLIATCEANVGETARRVLPGWSAEAEAASLFHVIPDNISVAASRNML